MENAQLERKLDIEYWHCSLLRHANKFYIRRLTSMYLAPCFPAVRDKVFGVLSHLFELEVQVERIKSMTSGGPQQR